MREYQNLINRIQMINGNIRMYFLMIWISAGAAALGYAEIEKEFKSKKAPLTTINKKVSEQPL